MEVKEIIPSGRFNKTQLDLLKMFSVDIPENDWQDIREYLKRYFANKATEEMNKLFEENGWGDEKIEEWANEHMRTPYKR